MNLIIDSAVGTHIQRSLFGELVLAYRDRSGDNYAHSAAGELVYDPVNRHNKKGCDPWWLIAKADNQISRYYANQLTREFGVRLDLPAWGSHVSIIRGVEPVQNRERWAYNNGSRYEMLYTPDVYTNGVHWWLNVKCDVFDEHRTLYGLPEGKRHFHLTVGRTSENSIIKGQL